MPQKYWTTLFKRWSDDQVGEFLQEATESETRAAHNDLPWARRLHRHRHGEPCVARPLLTTSKLVISRDNAGIVVRWRNLIVRIDSV